VLLVLSLAYWFCFFAWFRFLLCWRFFRIWAEADGIAAPENVTFCLASLANVRSLWKDWQASLYLWLQRYVYLPLGGSRVLWAPLNVMIVFSFVFFVHDPELRRFDSFGVMFGFFACAIVLEIIFSRFIAAVSTYRPLVAVLWHLETFFIVTLFSGGLLVVMSMVGTTGWQDTWKLLKLVRLDDKLLPEQLTVYLVAFYWSVYGARVRRTSVVELHDAGAVPSGEGAVVSASGSSVFWKAWQTLREVPPILICGFAFTMMLYCYTLSAWHWERFEPYLTPVTRGMDGTHPKVYYAACEQLRLNAFIRAPSNALSSWFGLAAPMYLLWQAPLDLPLIMKHTQGCAKLFMLCFYLGGIIVPLALVCTSFLWHSSIASQALHMDIIAVFSTMSAQIFTTAGSVLLQMPSLYSFSSQIQKTSSTAEQDAALFHAENFRKGEERDKEFAQKEQGLARCAVCMVCFTSLALSGVLHRFFGTVVQALAVLLPGSHFYLASVSSKHLSRHYKLLLCAAGIFGILAAGAKALDERQEYFGAMIFCSPTSPLQLTAVMHVLYSIAGLLASMASRGVLMTSLGLEGLQAVTHSLFRPSAESSERK
jgi:hypothetical protein